MWTQFWDMYSGGSTKEGNYDKIYIEAPEEEAKLIFYNRFGHDPEDIGCSCCGENYSIDEKETLEQLTGYHRNCKYDGEKYVEEPDTYYNSSKLKDYKTVEEYCKQDNVLVIKKEEIKDNER